MWGPLAGVGLFVGMCAWMAYGDDDPRWVRGAIRNVVLIAGLFAVFAVGAWALDGWGVI